MTDNRPCALPGDAEAAELHAMMTQVSAMVATARERYIDYASHDVTVLHAAIFEVNAHPDDDQPVNIDECLDNLRDKSYAEKLTICRCAFFSAIELQERIVSRLNGWRNINPLVATGDLGWEATHRRASSLPPPVARAIADLPASMVPLRLIDDDRHAVGSLVRGLLDRGAFSIVYGQPNAGKSFIALDLAMRIASGTRWRDRATTAGSVLYVAAEGAIGLRRRACAWRETNGHAEAPFAVMERSYDLTSARDAGVLLGHIRSWQAQTVRPVALVVIDTLARNLGGADENSGAAMGGAISNAGRIQRETGAHVMVIHHSGKDIGRGPRGHNSLPGAADTIIRVEVGAAVVEKMRDGEKGDVFPFKIAPIQFDGFASAVIEHVEAGVISNAGQSMVALLAGAVHAAAAAGRPLKANKAGGVYERRAELPEPLCGMSRSSLAALVRDAVDTGVIAKTAGLLSAVTHH